MENKTTNLNNLDKLLDYLQNPKHVTIIVIFIILFIQLNIVFYNLFTHKIVSRTANSISITAQTIAPTDNTNVDLSKTQSTSVSPSETNKNIVEKQIPSQTKITYACDPIGICNVYADPKGFGQCPMIFTDSNCSNKCGDGKNRCKK